MLLEHVHHIFLTFILLAAMSGLDCKDNVLQICHPEARPPALQ